VSLFYVETGRSEHLAEAKEESMVEIYNAVPSAAIALLSGGHRL
jgi:hypothetical protein